ncbi:hypothetical protein Pan153_51890 [Gimesia panareensis]|uniref:Uncharacterized protein n=1 Tax=Gimesia panareensis TaxID=2527978 RepID=A0A518FVZ3_9PLAN|nr:hypothetical protein Pan153_51890 [Gimesia panareensis]
MLNRSVTRLTLFEKSEDHAEFMRVNEETGQIITLLILSLCVIFYHGPQRYGN